MIDSNIKKLAEEWDAADPNDPDFWNKIESQNKNLESQKRMALRGVDA